MKRWRQRTGTHSRMHRLKTRAQALSAQAAKPRVKRIASSGVALVALILFGYFTTSGLLNEAYYTVLLAGALGLFIWAWPRALLGLTAVFLFTQPLLITLSSSSYNSAKIIYSIWAIALIWVLWIGYALWRQRWELELTRLIWPTIALVGAMAISLIHAEHLWADAQYLLVFALFAAFGILVASLVETRSDVMYLIGSLLASALIAALYGLLQYLGVLAGEPSSDDNAAIISSFGNRNYLGGFLVYLYLPGLALVLLGRSIWIRGFAVVTLATLYVSFVAIDSDSVWIAWLVSLGVSALGVLGFRLWRMVTAQWRWLAAVVIVTAVAMAAFQVNPLWLAMGDMRSQVTMKENADGDETPTLRFASLDPVASDGNDAEASEQPVVSSETSLLAQAFQYAENPAFIGKTRSLQVRLIDWLIGYHMFADTPLVGIGLGDYKRQWLDYKAQFYTTDLGQRMKDTIDRYVARAAQAHNEYVQIGAEMGVIGILAMLGFLGMLGYETYWRLRIEGGGSKRNADSDARRFLVLGLAGGVIAFMSDSLFSFPLHLPPNALALTAMLGLLCSPVLGPTQFRIRLRSTAKYVTATVVVIVALGASVFAYREWAADIYLQAGKGLLLSGDRRGIELIEESIDLAIAPGQAPYWLGALYAYNERPKEALHYLNQAQPIYNNEFSYYMLAYSHFLNRDWSASASYLATLQAMDPPSAIQQEADYLQAVIAANNGELDRAKTTFRRLLDDGFQPVKMNVNLAEVYVQLRQTALAQTHLNEATSLIEKERESLSEELAEESSREGGLRPAQKRLEELGRLRQRIGQLMAQIDR